jgi:hypothetical protein
MANETKKVEPQSPKLPDYEYRSLTGIERLRPARDPGAGGGGSVTPAAAPATTTDSDPGKNSKS